MFEQQFVCRVTASLLLGRKDFLYERPGSLGTAKNSRLRKRDVEHALGLAVGNRGVVNVLRQPDAVDEAARRPGGIEAVEVGGRRDMGMPDTDIADRVLAETAIIVERGEQVGRNAELLQRKRQKRLVAREIVRAAELLA